MSTSGPSSTATPHLFLASYHAELSADSNELKVSEIKAFITSRALITVHGPDMDPEQLTAHWDAEPDLTRHGVSFLLWGLLDLIVDGHFDTVQELDAWIDSLEDVLFDDHTADMTCSAGRSNFGNPWCGSGVRCCRCARS